jgi:hypothetical protein
MIVNEREGSIKDLLQKRIVDWDVCYANCEQESYFPGVSALGYGDVFVGIGFDGRGATDELLSQFIFDDFEIPPELEENLTDYHNVIVCKEIDCPMSSFYGCIDNYNSCISDGWYFYLAIAFNYCEAKKLSNKALRKNVFTWKLETDEGLFD